MLNIKYIELILYKVAADLRAETKRTYLGFLWWVFEPIMFMMVFYVVFGIINGRNTDGFVPFLLIGLTTWIWMQTSSSRCGTAISMYKDIMHRVHLPKIIYPIISILIDSVKFTFVFSLLIIYLWISGYGINITYVALPLVLLVEFLFIFAFCLFLAAVVQFLPDIKIVVDNVLQAIFFISGIFFTAKEVPEQYHGYYYLNPMTNLIEDYRKILIYAQWPDWQALLIIAIFSILGIIASAYLIRHYEYVYPKIIV
jgi:lipopolysaccharide transport system permease protein